MPDSIRCPSFPERSADSAMELLEPFGCDISVDYRGKGCGIASYAVEGKFVQSVQISLSIVTVEP